MLKQIIKDRTYIRSKEKIVTPYSRRRTLSATISHLGRLADEVVRLTELRYPDGVADVEGIQDIVEGAYRGQSRQDGQGLMCTAKGGRPAGAP